MCGKSSFAAIVSQDPTKLHTIIKMRHNNLYSLLSTIKLARPAEDFDGIVLVTRRNGLRSEYGGDREERARIDVETGDFQLHEEYAKVVIPRLIYDDKESSDAWKEKILRREEERINNYEASTSLLNQWKSSTFYHKQIE